MNENELKGITAYVNTGLAWEKAMGLIVTPLQATAPLVTRLIAEYGEQAARIAELEAEVKRLRTVADAAKVWSQYTLGDYLYDGAEQALIGAVDALFGDDEGDDEVQP